MRGQDFVGDRSDMRSDAMKQDHEQATVPLAKCRNCGGKPCICRGPEGTWAAHCMDCDNGIGQPGFIDHCALTEAEAEVRWNKLNSDPFKVT